MEVGSQRHAQAALPPGKKPGTHYTGGWVDPRIGLDGSGKSHPHRDSIPVPLCPPQISYGLNRDRTQLQLINIIIIIINPRLRCEGLPINDQMRGSH